MTVTSYTEASFDLFLRLPHELNKCNAEYSEQLGLVVYCFC